MIVTGNHFDFQFLARRHSKQQGDGNLDQKPLKTMGEA